MTPQCSIVNHAYRQIIDLQILLYYFTYSFSWSPVKTQEMNTLNHEYEINDF